MGQIRVLIVDDSAFMRHSLSRLLKDAPGIEVVGEASNGEEGLRRADTLRPDVITLDVEMPVLDGLGMLKRLMLETPTRVVMLSSRTTEHAQATLDALDYGAIDFVPKPSGSLSIDIGQVGVDLVSKITAAAGMSETAFLHHRKVAVTNLTVLDSQARLDAAMRRPAPAQTDVAGEPRTRTVPVPPERGRMGSQPAGPRVAARKLVVIASSTGGPTALHTVVKGLPPELGAAVAIVQHMPPGFTASLAARLDAIGGPACKEAAPNDVLIEDAILVAPGGYHLICSSTGHVQLVCLPAVNGVRPAADVTLEAVAPIWRERLLCVVLTGMGCDATDGARAVKQHGGSVISQDAATATMYGMPAAVADAGLSDRILPLHQIADGIVAWCASGRPADRTANAAS
jgi:two-component system chemotaxis response regulator CheB